MRDPGHDLSLATKLPLTIAVSLSVMLFAMGLAGYVEVRASTFARSAEQLDHAAREIVDLLGPSIRQRIASLQTAAARPAVVEFLTDPNPSTRAALTEQLGGTSKSAQTARLEIWNADRDVILSMGAALSPLSGAETKQLADIAMHSRQPAIGPFTQASGTVAQALAAPVFHDGAIVGFLVDRRRLTGSAQSMALLTGLIGADSRLLIGNLDGSLWTDFLKPVRTLPSAIAASPLTAYVRDNGTPVFGHAVGIPNAPWLIAVEVPQAPVLAPLHRYVQRATLLCIALALGGAGLGWQLSRRVTGPLRRMTSVAEAVAAERSSERISLDRGDELGRLARAFDTMVEHVERGRERLERRVAERTAELEAANRELEAFSYSVSHDLRAPLRAIAGFSRIVIEDHAESLPPEGRDQLQTIARNTQAMGQLIDDLLAFSRLGRQPITKASTDMAALFQTAIDDVRRAEPDRSIEFVVGAVPRAAVQRTLMKQVVDNLVQNAAKFTRARPAARIEVGFSQETERPAYYVRDNGAGFDMQYMDKLFGVFQRLHRADEFEGTGVGLAIVRRIVTRHGGQVWAEAAVDRGATFYFTIPHSEEVPHA